MIGKYGRMVVVLLAFALVVAACGDDDADTTEAPPTTQAGTTTEAPAELSADLLGAGASFPNPIYLEWIGEFMGVEPGISINYQSIGSGGGIEQFIAQATHFGGTDAFLKQEDFEAAVDARGCEPVHIPTVFGAVAVAFNVPGLDAMTLDGPTLAEIFLGSITKWNDPAIAALNAGVDLPDRDIVVVHRSDSSGTTSIFTTYLSDVSQAWADGPGAGKSPEWPTGVGGEKNDGVAAGVQQNDGSIGYVELSYAIENGIAMADMVNADGVAVTPTLESTAAAADGIEIPADLRFNILGVGGEGYPIAGATWILAWTCGYEAGDAAALQAFLTWALTEGDDLAEELLYAPIGAALEAQALAKVAMINEEG
jgi:phosphate transport system substrate-binding protein